MIQYITINLPEGKLLRLMFTRMTEDDTWICQLDPELMESIQYTIAQGFYGSI